MKPDLAKLLDTMVAEGIDTGHIVWPIAVKRDGTEKYALFELRRIDGEVVVTVA